MRDSLPCIGTGARTILAAIGLSDGLVTEAHAEDRHASGGCVDQRQADARLSDRTVPATARSNRAEGERVLHGIWFVALTDDILPESPR
jgi:hypothetical protein